jgi:hypothetical protein
VLEGKDAALQKQLEEEKLAAERAAEELEAAREAAALAPEEAVGADDFSQEFLEAGGERVSAAVIEAEEALDGRVRVPKLKRRQGEGRSGGGQVDGGEDVPTTDLP